MNRKKIFAAGCITLLLLITITPAVTSIRVNTIGKTNNDEYDIKIEILDGPYLKQRKPVIRPRDGVTCTLWEVKYRITNNYDKRLRTKPMVCVLSGDEAEVVIDYWYVDLNLPPGQKFEGFHKIYAKISEDKNEDYEKYVADNLIKLECYVNGLADKNPIDNFDIRRVIKFWKKDDFYGPTLTQIEASLPWRYEEKTITIQDKEITIPEFTKLYEKGNRLAGYYCKGRTIQDIINSDEFKDLGRWVSGQIWDGWEEFWELLEKFVEKFEDVMDLFWEDLPNELDNHRFGWTKNVTRYIINIFVDMILFLLVAGSCAYTVVESPQFVYILGWMGKASNLFNTLFNGGSITSLFGEVFGIEVLSTLIIYATGLLTLIEICGGIELFLFAKLKYDFQQLKEWRSKEPWLQDIRVRGRVDYVRDGETVTVECQGVKQIVKEEKDGKDGSIQFNFVIPAKYPYKTPQKCVITVTGDHPSHQGKPLQTLGVLSYCFSGGEIYKWFQSESWRKTKNIESIAHVPLLKILLQKFDDFFYERNLNTAVVNYLI